jgi:hypothetical protein
VPAQDRGRGDEAMPAQRRGQALDECGEQRSVGPVQSGLGVGSAEYGDLVAQDEEFDVLGCRCAAEQCQRAQKSADDQVEQAQRHGRDHAWLPIPAGQTPSRLLEPRKGESGLMPTPRARFPSSLLGCGGGRLAPRDGLRDGQAAGRGGLPLQPCRVPERGCPGRQDCVRHPRQPESTRLRSRT